MESVALSNIKYAPSNLLPFFWNCCFSAINLTRLSKMSLRGLKTFSLINVLFPFTVIFSFFSPNLSNFKVAHAFFRLLQMRPLYFHTRQICFLSRLPFCSFIVTTKPLQVNFIYIPLSFSCPQETKYICHLKSPCYFDIVPIFAWKVNTINTSFHFRPSIFKQRKNGSSCKWKIVKTALKYI